MRLMQCYRKAASVLALTWSVVLAAPAQAETINFSAMLTNGTCALSLDRSILPLGTVSPLQFTPGRLLAPKPFTLFIRNCTGSGLFTPQVSVFGNGVTQDNKWLFRNAGSAAGIGIMVIQSDTVPDYSQSEIKDGTIIQVANTGQIPADQELTFYAGASCGGTTGCAEIGSGEVTATLMFDFAYQ
ncbi:fimbrial protein [Serratia oryzae]|uniref:Fimbrial-type adhesion domain-containing protein n=1 Tax=Serratia oryzae TaxID=2034155 RepID=A0A1S8CL23_9GAMM|nr:fimbrial protein [Serratia oryzae]OMQ23691.1 hypothetical protein BMI79_09265 [Serratia oryzae]